MLFQLIREVQRPSSILKEEKPNSMKHRYSGRMSLVPGTTNHLRNSGSTTAKSMSSSGRSTWGGGRGQGGDVYANGINSIYACINNIRSDDEERGDIAPGALVSRLHKDRNRGGPLFPGKRPRRPGLSSQPLQRRPRLNFISP